MTVFYKLRSLFLKKEKKNSYLKTLQNVPPPPFSLVEWSEPVSVFTIDQMFEELELSCFSTKIIQTSRQVSQLCGLSPQVGILTKESPGTRKKRCLRAVFRRFSAIFSDFSNVFTCRMIFLFKKVPFVFKRVFLVCLRIVWNLFGVFWWSKIA